MEKNKINNLIEYLSPILVLSYFFIHNIFLVLIGITFSLYLTNLNSINKTIRYIKKSIITDKLSEELDEKDSSKEIESFYKKPKKEDSKLTLVQKIEELGYIPSIDKNKKGNVA